MKFDRKYLLCSLGYAVFGLCVGVYMGASQNHGEFVAHAHILLIGFVLSFIYGLIHKLWINAENSAAATWQFYLHQLSALVISISLLLFYGGLFQHALEPILGASSVGVLVSALMMVYLIFRFSVDRGREPAH